MKNYRFLFICFILCFGSIILKSQTLSTQQIASIETIIKEEMIEANMPGSAFGIINQNKVVYEKPFGIANSLTGIPLTDSSIFQIASVTKIFTSLALLTELKKANINVNEPIGDLIKGLSARLSKLTYHQLLTHTSGMVDFIPSPKEYSLDTYTFFKNSGDSLLFTEPGIVFSYSNIGYVLAGLALERISNKPYPQAIQDIIIGPLRLQNTTFDLYKVACRSFSSGHYFNHNLNMMSPYLSHLESPLVQAAGGLFSTIKDLERFAICLINQGELDGKNVFDKDVLLNMSTGYAKHFMASGPYYGFMSYPNNAYGYGLFMFKYGDLGFIGNGGSGSQMTYFIYEPQRKFAMISINNSNSEFLINSFKKIFEVVLGEKELQPTKFYENKLEWKEIAGTYILHNLKAKDESRLEIFEKDGSLYIRFGTSPDIKIDQIGVLTYKFIIPGSRFPLELVFYRNHSGKINYMSHFWRAWEKI
ncbi:MAG: serine hydrolase domain-containing protein [Bacteroidales bacterium]